MLPESLRKKFRRLELSTKKSVDNAFGGEYVSAFKGQGMEFSEVRLYQAGDDIRMIDWNVTARTGEAHIKLHTEERELVVLVMLDVSASSKFGSHVQRKCDMGLEVAALLAFAAANHNDKVGLALFTDHIESFIAPKKDMKHTMRLIEHAFMFKPTSQKTSLSHTLEELLQRQKKRALIFLISDFMDSHFEKSLRVASKRHDVVAIRITDPREYELPEGLGFLNLEDPETGQSQTVHLGDKDLRAAYQKQAHRLATSTLGQIRASNAELMDISTRDDALRVIRKFMHARKKKFS